jgi:hypothetical protein
MARALAHSEIYGRPINFSVISRRTELSVVSVWRIALKFRTKGVSRGNSRVIRAPGSGAEGVTRKILLKFLNEPKRNF